MLAAEFLAGLGDAEFEIGIANLGAPAGDAAVEACLGFRAETAQTPGVTFLDHAVADKNRRKKEQVIGEGSSHGHFGGQGKNDELQAENGRHEP